MSAPFTPEQEARIRELVREEAVRPYRRLRRRALPAGREAPKGAAQDPERILNLTPAEHVRPGAEASTDA